MFNMTQAEVKSRRAALEAELATLDEQEQRLEGLTPAMQLAEALHKAFCHLNHTDACSWGYEEITTGYGNGHTHDEFLFKANNLLEKFPHMTAEEIIEVGRMFKR